MISKNLIKSIMQFRIPSFLLISKNLIKSIMKFRIVSIENSNDLKKFNQEHYEI